MKPAHSALALWFAALALTCAPCSAAEKAQPEAKITLEDVIFDVAYLKKFLGPKTLVTALVESNRGRKKADTALADAIKAVKDAKLDEKSQIFVLPDDAAEPVLKSSIPHSYPPGLNITREPKKADFLMLIGADGSVKCLYCYNNNDRLFALAAAKAVLKWRYKPAKIKDTAVPVLAGLPMEFQSGDDVLDSFKNKPRHNQEGGMPTRILTPAPAPPGGG
jgi:hypothetical protein